MPSGQCRITEQAKFAYSSLGRAFTIEEQRKKLVEALEVLDPKKKKKSKTKTNQRTFSKRNEK